MSNRRKLIKNIAKITEFVRNNGKATSGDISKLLVVSLSTAYQYMKMVSSWVEDIEYINGMLLQSYKKKGDDKNV